MARTHQNLTVTHQAESTFRLRARAIGEPEHFFVGLSEARLPRVRNIVFFCKKELSADPKDTSHHRHMLILNLETEVSLLLDGLMMRLAPGQALLVFPFQAHRYLGQKGKKLTWLFITFELGETELLEDMRNRPVEIPSDLRALAELLLAEYEEARRSQKTADEVAALLSYFLLRLSRECRRTAVVQWEAHLPLPSHRLVQRATRSIVSRLDKPISVRQLAEELAVSGGYLRNCFCRVLGLPVTVYIRRTRIYAACALLSRTESNITEIAEKCGFSSVYAFSRAFAREMGRPPTRYRVHLWEQGNIAKPGRKR